MLSDVWWGRKLKTSHCLHVVITQLWADSHILLSWVLWSCDGMGEMRQVKRLGKKGRPLGWQRSEFTQGWKCRAQRTILDHRHWNTTFPSVTRQLWFKTSKENQWKGFQMKVLWGQTSERNWVSEEGWGACHTPGFSGRLCYPLLREAINVSTKCCLAWPS